VTAPRDIRVGLVGFGYWGSNLARNLDGIQGCELGWCCEPEAERCELAQAAFPGVRVSDDLEALLADPSIDAVAIATPVTTHAPIAERAIGAGKHCFVEKPLALRTSDAERVAAAAAERGLVLMVGHLLEYHPALVALARLVADGDLGEIHYIHSRRLNLGRLRADENALWSLGAHDVAAILRLTGESPVEVSARGESYVRSGIEDVVFGHLRFPSGVSAHIHLSWLDPQKERRLTVVGSRRMATFDDMAATDKLTVFDKGFDPGQGEVDGFVERCGPSRVPPFTGKEPLRLELEHFVECVAGCRQPRSDGGSGVRVVAVLEALQRSLEAGGALVAPEPQGSYA
jgi:predicted dehydrogenase